MTNVPEESTVVRIDATDTPEVIEHKMATAFAPVRALLAAHARAFPPAPRQGGPWTRHGHRISGITVDGPGRPEVKSCGGPFTCSQCQHDTAAARLDQQLATEAPCATCGCLAALHRWDTEPHQSHCHVHIRCLSYRPIPEQPLHEQG